MNYALIKLIGILFDVFSFLILLDVIASWIVAARVRLPNWVYDILSTVHSIVAPVLDPIRRLIPGLGGLDISPIIALILLGVLRQLIVSALLGVL